MKSYRIIHDYHVSIVEVEDFQCEQDAVDSLINHLESEGCEGCFLSHEDVEHPDGIACDMYVIGGNHGRYLYHGGNFRIEAA